jgi:hypothetical protein
MKKRRPLSIVAAILAASLYHATAKAQTLGTNGMQGMNWSNSTSNAVGVNGDGLAWPDGMSGSDTTSQAYAAGQTAGQAILTAGGYTVRMPITTALTTGSNWTLYQNTINGVISKGVKVILCWWPASGNDVSNTTTWYAMWDAVNTVYGGTMNVRYEPINEPAAYDSTDLDNLYAAFLSRYSPANYKVILDGTGYASSVTAVGSDSRLANQMLALHVYSWYFSAPYSGGGASWQGYYNAVAAAVGSYAWRTVVTEIGVQTDGRSPSVPFWQQWDFDLQPDQAVLSGALAWARDNSVATIAWSGINNTDLYHWFHSFSNLTEVNTQVTNMFRWGWKEQNAVVAGTYRIKNRNNSEYLDNLGSTSSGADVGQWSSTGGNNQKWILVQNGSVWWHIENVDSSDYLDGLGKTANGSPLVQYSNSGSTNQYWAFEATDSGYYKLINQTTGVCIDTDGSTLNGADMQQWASDTSYNQQWIFTQ